MTHAVRNDANSSSTGGRDGLRGSPPRDLWRWIDESGARAARGWSGAIDAWRCANGLLALATVVLTAGLFTGCTLYRYDPAAEIDIERLADQGCRKGEHGIVRAELNRVYEDSVVLWDGRDPDTTYTIRFKGPGVGRKTKSLLGKNRYERAYEALSDVMDDGRPVEVAFVCEGQRKTPVATRLSFRDPRGDEVAFEF